MPEAGVGRGTVAERPRKPRESGVGSEPAGAVAWVCLAGLLAGGPSLKLSRLAWLGRLSPGWVDKMDQELLWARFWRWPGADRNGGLVDLLGCPGELILFAGVWSAGVAG